MRLAADAGVKIGDYQMGETVVKPRRRPREVLLVGSVPLRPVSKVFETVARHLGDLAPRIPDGEMMGWLRSIWRSHAENQPYSRLGLQN